MRNLILAILFVLTSPVHAGNQAIVNADLFNGVYAPKNYVLNSHFEKNSLGITDSSSIASRTKILTVDGDASLLVDATASGQVVKIQTKYFDNALRGGNCGAFFWYRGDASLYKAYVEQGSTNVSGNPIQLENVGEGRQTPHLNFPCGSGPKDTYVVIEATDDAADAIRVDNFYVGKALNVGSVNEARWVGSISWQGTANCEWTKTSTGYTDFPADSDCPDPVVKGSLRAPSTKVPGFNLDVLPGHYEIKVTDALVQASTGTTGLYRWSDGTNTFGGGWTGSGDNRAFSTLDGTINYDSPQSDVPFRIQAQNFTGGNTARIYNQQGDRALTIDVYYFPTQSQTAVRMDQTDYGWTAYTPTFTGFGTVTGISCEHRRSGPDLLQRCKFTTGTPTATEARVSFPGSLVSSSTVPTLEYAGKVVCASGLGADDVQVLIEPSVGYFTFALQNSTNNGLTKRNGTIFSSTQTCSMTARAKIQGWIENQNAPLVVGGVTSSYGGVGMAEWIQFGGASQYSVCSSPTCTIYRQSGAFTSVTRSGTGQYVLNIKNGVFSGPPTCVPVSVQFVRQVTKDAAAGTDSATAVYIGTFAAGSDTRTDSGLSLLCFGPR